MGVRNASMLTFEAIGTHWQIDYSDQRTPEARAVLAGRIKQEITEFDKKFSRFRPDSWVADMAKSPGIFEVGEEVRELFDLYVELYQITNGAFTPLIGDTLESLGYDSEYSLVTKEPRLPFAWRDALEYHFPKVKMKQATMLDLGAAGKGYLIDIIGDLIESHGIKKYCIDAGGDIRHRDQSDASLRVGLEDPHDPHKVIGVITLCNQSICCSAGNRRRWGTYHHIIDPLTLRSPEHIASVWTIAGSTMRADALATCLFLVEPDILRERFDFEYCIMKPDREIECSSGFGAEFFGQTL